VELCSSPGLTTLYGELLNGVLKQASFPAAFTTWNDLDDELIDEDLLQEVGGCVTLSLSHSS
jgi:hypothetical protein